MSAHAHYSALHAQLATHIKGQDEKLHYILACFFTGYHVLLEDYPGTGKTTLAKSLSALLPKTNFKRVQFTPDLLPSDLTGVNIFNPEQREFIFHKGPLFCDLLLADEINRASPRTQSALLEAMAERQVTIEGTTYPLPDDFFVIATQNPVEFRGTYPLPEAQMDRFGLQCSLGYLSNDQERNLLDEHLESPLQRPDLSSTLPDDLMPLVQAEMKQVTLSEGLKDYLISIVAKTRTHDEVQLPLSPRATLTLATLAQAVAFCREKPYVTASIIQELAPFVLAHRLLLRNPSQNTTTGKRQFIKALLDELPVPQ